MKQYLLGLDNGGTLCKAALFDLQGRQAAQAAVQIPLQTPREGFTQRPMESIRQANFQLIRDITAACDGEILAIGVTGHGKGLYLLGQGDRFIYDGIGSTDSRALAYQLQWKKDGTAQAVREKTAQAVMACQPVALLRWLKDHEPQVYGKIGCILAVKDFVRWCLTGEAYCEYTDVSGTNLLNLHTLAYDPALLEAFGIEEVFSKLPPIKASHELAGHVTPACAAETGLKPGTPVVGGMFDIDASAVAAGTIHPGDLCLVAGTWSINEYISETLNHRVAMNSVYCDPRYYLSEESSAASAGNLEWFRAMLKNTDYNELNAMVEALPPAEHSAYYLPFLYASNEDPLAKGALVGLRGNYSQAHVVRAVFEGAAYSHRTHVDALLRSGCTPALARLAGGVTRSPVWAQMFADVLNLPVQLVDTDELGAKGAAMAAGIGAGVYTDYEDAVEKCVRPGRLLQPDPHCASIYEKKYQAYKAIVAALAPVWEKL